MSPALQADALTSAPPGKPSECPVTSKEPGSLCLVAQLCLILWDPVDCSLPSFPLSPGDSLGKKTGMSCHALLLGVFPTQGSNPDLPHCWQILYHMSRQGSHK